MGGLEPYNDIDNRVRLTAFVRWFFKENRELVKETLIVYHKVGRREAYKYFYQKIKQGDFQDHTLKYLIEQNIQMHGFRYVVNKFYNKMFHSTMSKDTNVSEIKPPLKNQNLDTFFSE
jgi:hypothetical protein